MIVYCTKCGTNNADNATVCVNCGTPLYGASNEGRHYIERVTYEREYSVHRRGRPITDVIIGAIIIIIGFSVLLQEYDTPVPLWEIMLTMFGIYLVARWFRVCKRPK